MTAVVYWLFDSEDTILYIGCTRNIEARMTNHYYNKSWWPSVVSVAHTDFMPRVDALQLESEDIADLRPIHNIQNRRNIYPPAPPTNLIGSAEATSILQIDRATFNRWAVKGKVPTAIKASGRTQPRLFDRAVIERLAAERAA